MSLTADQQERLDSLIHSLEGFPIAEMIRETQRVIIPPDTPFEKVQQRMRLGVGASYAATRILDYLTMLRWVNRALLEMTEPLKPLTHKLQSVNPRMNPEDAVWTSETNHVSGLEEVGYHFFVICVVQFDALLPEAAKGAGITISGTDKRVLKDFVDLRNHFEHLEDRLPGHRNAAMFVKETGSTPLDWRIEMGMETDDKGRLVLNDVIYDVTPEGLTRIEEVVERNLERLRSGCVELVRKHFERHPEIILGPEDLNQGSAVSVLSPLARVMEHLKQQEARRGAMEALGR